MMRKTLVYLPEQLHFGLKEIAHRRSTTMSNLVRKALEQAYEDELDAIDMEQELKEYASDPSSAMSWEEFKASLKRGVPA